MSHTNTRFCAIMLQQAFLDLTGRESRHFKAKAKIIEGSTGHFYGEWPMMGTAGKTFYAEVEADNMNHAKAQFIQKWLDTESVNTRQRHTETRFPE